MIRRILLLGALTWFVPRVLVAQNPPPTPPMVVLPARTPAQDAAAALGKNVSNAEIADAIAKSGLTEAQLRARLNSAGFDPKLADPFFAAGASGSTGGVAQSGTSVDPGFATALRALGIIDAEAPENVDADKKKINDDEDQAKRNRERTAVNAAEIGVFGKRFFTTGTTAFDAVTAGPVDASYRLGVGDQLQMVITGDLELALGLDVRRDGTVLIPSVGQVSVAGLTLEAARTSIKARAARVYSLIGEGKARLDLTVSRVRSNQVFVVGEVERPGSYQVSALGTVFRALSMAGGPTVRGSFRNVEVRRAGSVVAQVDIYDYLLHGDASHDIRTEQGDIVFVGLSKRLVVLQGAVRRPGIYELREGETFARLLEFGGGLLPTASTDRLQIDRVLPPAQRTPGRDRALIDVPFNAHVELLDTLRLYDNDIVSVFAVGDIRRNRISIAGEVFQPGMYEWARGMTASKLIEKAQGFLPWALTDKVKIERPVSNSGLTDLFSLNATDTSFANFQLQEFDAVTVLDGRKAYQAGTVAVRGAVHTPGVRAYEENTSLKDLIDFANGFEPWALRDQVKLTRTDASTGRKVFFTLNFADSVAAHFPVRAFDQVDVLDAREANPSGSIEVSGSVVKPGSHIYADGQTINDVIALAGGFKLGAASVELSHRHVGATFSDTSAVIRTYQIMSDGRLEEAAAHAVLGRGDRISVRDTPGFRSSIESVFLSGFFAQPGNYVIRTDKERVSDVVRRAGGLLPNAYPESGRLIREGRSVPIDLRLAMSGNMSNDIRISGGDRLLVGDDPSTVVVSGAVERQVIVPFHQGWDVTDYVDAAGGFSADADHGRVTVEYPSGAIHRRKRLLFFGSNDATVISGSSIVVARNTENKSINTSEVITRVMQITTTLVSLLIGYVTVRKL